MERHGHWLSLVFQHWNTHYFEAILEEAPQSGATLKSAVTQIGDTIWSMHKKKNKEKVLAGEMILNFIKDGKGCSPARGVRSQPTIDKLVEDALVQVSPDRRPFPGELLFNHIVLEAWKRGALHSLDLTREQLSEVLTNKGWHYDPAHHHWFNTHTRIRSGFQLAF